MFCIFFSASELQKSTKMLCLTKSFLLSKTVEELSQLDKHEEKEIKKDREDKQIIKLNSHDPS